MNHNKSINNKHKKQSQLNLNDSDSSDGDALISPRRRNATTRNYRLGPPISSLRNNGRQRIFAGGLPRRRAPSHVPLHVPTKDGKLRSQIEAFRGAAAAGNQRKVIKYGNNSKDEFKQQQQQYRAAAFELLSKLKVQVENSQIFEYYLDQFKLLAKQAATYTSHIELDTFVPKPEYYIMDIDKIIEGVASQVNYAANLKVCEDVAAHAQALIGYVKLLATGTNKYHLFTNFAANTIEDPIIWKKVDEFDIIKSGLTKLREALAEWEVRHVNVVNATSEIKVSLTGVIDHNLCDYIFKTWEASNKYDSEEEDAPEEELKNEEESMELDATPATESVSLLSGNKGEGVLSSTVPEVEQSPVRAKHSSM